MAEAPPSSSWHPALMPNSEEHATAPASSDIATEPSTQASDLPSDSFGSWEQPPRSNGQDAWGGDDGGAWLDSEKPTQAVTEDVSQHDSANAETRSSPTKNTAQHSSSMSFARTVSHEPNFMDDDDPEWTLPRTDTDPFKFMAPSDRTNTFPTVPPRDEAESHESHDETPLPATQAEDIMEEVNHEPAEQLDLETVVEDSQNGLNNRADEAQRHRHVSSGSMGGDLEAVNDSPVNTRYEEGVPLLSHAQDEGNEQPKVAQSAPSGNLAAFAEDDGDDDFFSGNQAISNDEPDVPSLHRKSTSQAMGDLTNEQLSRNGTALQELEEDDEADDWLHGNGVNGTTPKPAGGEDLSAKWEAAFGGDDDDEDFLLEEDNVNESAFLGSDDEGLLDDEPGPAPAAPRSYVPSGQPTNSYTPATPYQSTQSPYGGPPQQSATIQGGAPATQSFANQSKGGYSSPYDLPTDLVKTVQPRKRPSMQQMAPSLAQPPRSASASMPPPSDNMSPPGSSHGVSLNQKASTSSLRKSNSSFFEDLPMSSKPRPGSRHSNRAPSPAQLPPTSHPVLASSPLAHPSATQAAPSPPASNPVPGANLVAPARVSPYATLQSAAPPAPMNSRYSPAASPASQSGAPLGNRYSPAPSQTQSRSSSYNPAVPQSNLPHQPRTSSPLAHYDSSASLEGARADRRTGSFSHEARLNRVPSLPPTREVDEEETSATQASNLVPPPPAPSSQSRYSPAPQQQSYAAPPPAGGASPKRNYAPQAASAAQSNVPPPQRSQTLSPGATRVNAYAPQPEAQRPSSAHSNQPVKPAAPQPTYGSKAAHARRKSIKMNCVPPTDGREQDPLERWKGAPILTWGLGGTVITSFPQSIPRYAVGQTAPTFVRTHGEVKLSSIKDLEPLQERLSKFPGPLKGKSKKKEVVAWLSAGIETLQKELPDLSFHSELSLEAKRAIERLLLWKILRVFIEHDGVLEGNPAVVKAVRDVLSPGEDANVNGDTQQPGTLDSQAAPVQADGADSGAVEQLRLTLMGGDREAAAWAAVDKRLWGHAMLIANTVSADLYRQVSQEFVRKEVNYAGHNNESLAALYKIFSGNFEECVDELVPSHARAGLQLLSTQAAGAPSKGTIDGLDKWQETLTLVLSNRSPNDIQGLKALGELLASYGRAEAAHICFIFGRQASVFGGIDDPAANMVLIGSDHRQQSDQFGKEMEALQLSEVYEYGLTLTGGPLAAAGAPHLAGYKLQQAISLAEYGHRDKALQYCENLNSAMISQTKRSPYYHARLEAAVGDFMTRLKQAPKEEGSGWMSKPSMNKVSDTMWNRFNKFVAGDESEGGANGMNGEGENGPFARIASSPNLSRSPSAANLDMYGQGTPPSFGMSPVMTAAATSRYAPMTNHPAAAASPYSPAPTSAAAPSPYSASPYEPAYPAATPAPVANGTYGAEQAHTTNGLSTGQSALNGYQPYGVQDSPDLQPSQGGAKLSESPMNTFSTPAYGYEPPQMNLTDAPGKEEETP